MYQDGLEADRRDQTVEGQRSTFEVGLLCFFAIAPVVFLFQFLPVSYKVPSSLLLCAGMLWLIKASLRDFERRLEFHPAVHALWKILLIWSAATIVRGITPDRFAVYAWCIKYYAWAWVVPVCMPLGASLSAWRSVLTLAGKMTKVGIVVVVLARFLGTNTGLGFFGLAPYAVVLLTCVPKRSHAVLWAGAIVGMFLSVLSSERNLLIADGLMILGGIHILGVRAGVDRVQRRIRIAVALSVFALLAQVTWTRGGLPFLSQRENTQLAGFKEGLFVNSRYGEDHSLYRDFLNDVKGIDWAIGRGCMGKYKGFIGHQTSWVMRREIECGYFQTILKGGVVMLVLILALAVPAVYLGLFRSRNWFVRGCAIIVLVRLIEMVFFGLPAADLRYVMFWLAIGCCLSGPMRSQSEQEIMEAFSVGPEMTDQEGYPA